MINYQVLMLDMEVDLPALGELVGALQRVPTATSYTLEANTSIRYSMAPGPSKSSTRSSYPALCSLMPTTDLLPLYSDSGTR